MHKESFILVLFAICNNLNHSYGGIQKIIDRKNFMFINLNISILDVCCR